jgi:hypothetical protein
MKTDTGRITRDCSDRLATAGVCLLQALSVNLFLE